VNLFSEKLSEEVKEKLDKLPNSYNSANDLTKFQDFFVLYGTHYVVSASFGASLIMKSTMKSQEEMSKSAIEAKAKAAYGSMFSVDTQTSSGSSDSSKIEVGDIQINVSGGSLDIPSDGKIPKEKQDAWQKSIMDSPVSILESYNIVSISGLLDPEEVGKRKAIDKAVIEYMKQKNNSMRDEKKRNEDEQLAEQARRDALKKKLAEDTQEKPKDKVVEETQDKAGCFDVECNVQVLMPTGKVVTKKAGDIKRGDMVQVFNKTKIEFARVCYTYKHPEFFNVLKINYRNKKTSQVGSLSMTRNHVVLMGYEDSVQSAFQATSKEVRPGSFLYGPHDSVMVVTDIENCASRVIAIHTATDTIIVNNCMAYTYNYGPSFGLLETTYQKLMDPFVAEGKDIPVFDSWISTFTAVCFPLAEKIEKLYKQK